MGVRGLVLSIGVATFAASGCTSGGPASNPTAPRSTVEQQLWTIASKAADDADSDAASASAVKTTYRAALRLMTRHTVSGTTDRPVWLIQILGTHAFSCECGVFPSRSGDSAAHAAADNVWQNYMLIVANGAGLRMIAGADLYAERQPIETLGRAIDLHP